MPNGNMFNALHKNNGEKAFKGGNLNLNWPKQYKIAFGEARELAYLHHECTTEIVHRIKSTNILLDKAKIVDFGVAKTPQVCRGKDPYIAFSVTHGYIVPECAYSFKVKEKRDTYSLLELVRELIV
eukprot:Gb_15918 [translate_table: standard]